MIRPLSRLALVLDIVGAVVLFATLTPASLVFYGPGSLSYVGVSEAVGIAATVLAGVLQCGAVAVGRLAPGISLTAAWVGALVQMAAGLAPLPINFAILLVLYATAAWGSRRVLWAGIISAGAGAVIAGVYITLINGIDASNFGLSVGAASLLVAVSILALGLAWVSGLLWRIVLRARGIRKAQALAEEMAAEEQERVRIARDMHDIVAHSLAVVIAQADGARYASKVDPAAAPAALTTIAQTARGALSDVRMLLTQLRHRQGDGPQPTLADLEALLAQVRDAGMDPRVTVDPMPPGEPPGVIQLAVYRILQEALTNALRHGTGDPVDVSLAWHSDRVDIEVANTIDAAHPIGAGGGHGIIGMRERAQLVGGVLRAEREDNRFLVRARLPIAGMQARQDGADGSAVEGGAA